MVNVWATLPSLYVSTMLRPAHLLFMHYQDQWIEAWFPRGLLWGVLGTGACPAPVPALLAQQATPPWCAQAWNTTIARAWCLELWWAAPTVYQVPGLCCSNSSWKWVGLSFCYPGVYCLPRSHHCSVYYHSTQSTAEADGILCWYLSDLSKWLVFSFLVNPPWCPALISFFCIWHNVMQLYQLKHGVCPHNTRLHSDTDSGGSVPFRSDRVNMLLFCMFARWVHTKWNRTLINFINNTSDFMSI